MILSTTSYISLSSTKPVIRHTYCIPQGHYFTIPDTTTSPSQCNSYTPPPNSLHLSEVDLDLKPKSNLYIDTFRLSEKRRADRIACCGKRCFRFGRFSIARVGVGEDGICEIVKELEEAAMDVENNDREMVGKGKEGGQA